MIPKGDFTYKTKQELRNIKISNPVNFLVGKQLKKIKFFVKNPRHVLLETTENIKYYITTDYIKDPDSSIIMFGTDGNEKQNKIINSKIVKIGFTEYIWSYEEKRFNDIDDFPEGAIFDETVDYHIMECKFYIITENTQMFLHFDVVNLYKKPKHLILMIK